MKAKSKSTTVAPATVRVAVYCRQSVASDLAFGSIQAQRESVEAFAKSQGWLVLSDDYSDGGFSGSTAERPAYKRLLVDVAAGMIDVVGVYRIDRVSRSLSDFTRFIELLDKHGVGFVSVTQSFDTRTSMGRLTLNILASFSQFERETIAERTRDKIAATRRKGMWTGGRPVLGYDVRNGALVINRDEAETVRTIFDLYLEHGGLVTTVAELDRRGIRNKSWTNNNGKRVYGTPFNKNSLRGLLVNPLYVGRIRAGKEVVEAHHDAIIGTAVFDQVARALREHRRTTRGPGKWGSILGGILRCARCGSAMSHAANVRGDRTHRYYVCATVSKQGAAACPRSRAPAGEIEEVVLSRIRTIGKDPAVLLATITAARQARKTKEPELIAEARRLSTDRTRLAAERTNLLDAIQHGGTAASVIATRLAEVDEHVARLDARHAEVTGELAAMATDAVDEAAVRDALEQYTPVWDELLPRERHRLLQLLVEEVRYDGQAGELEIVFRDAGIRALGREAHDRRTA